MEIKSNFSELSVEAWENVQYYMLYGMVYYYFSIVYSHRAYCGGLFPTDMHS